MSLTSYPPLPPSPEDWQPAFPSLFHKPRMTAKLGPGHVPMAGLHGFPSPNARTQGTC